MEYKKLSKFILNIFLIQNILFINFVIGKFMNSWFYMPIAFLILNLNLKGIVIFVVAYTK